MEKCPICKRDAKPRAENAHHPFCSARCKTVDLGKWLNEEYRVPTEEPEEEGSGGTLFPREEGSPERSKPDMRN